jgi:predicted transcriptional regulator
MDEPEKQSHRYSDEDVIEAVRNVDTATTMMVAEELGCSRSGAYQRLTKLRDDGRIASRDVGNSLLWSLND